MPAEPREEIARQQFEAATRKHQMKVLHDDGLYRHVRFAQPGPHSWSYLYDLVTWPGHLSISGDLESFTFRRTADMFGFFDDGLDRINPFYWGEKLVAPRGRDAVKVYVPELVPVRVGKWLDEVCEDLDADERAALREAAEEQILNREDIEWSHDAARSAVQSFEHDGLTVSDPGEWEFVDYDHHFLIACWAIKRGVVAYREAAAPAPETRTEASK